MLTTSHIEQVLSFYDLGKIENVTQADQGNVNATVFVETHYGRFVVRHNQQHLSEANHRYRHSLISLLYERNFPVPALIPTHDGDTLLKLDNRLYEVQFFVEGQDYNPDRPQHLTGIGTMLAQYHRSVNGFAQPRGEAFPRYHPRRVQGMTERLMECDVMGDYWASLAWYDARVAQLRAALASLNYECLPHRVIHGDIHAENVRFSGDRVAALIDFDQIAWDARVVDLVDALVSFATDHSYGNQMMWGVFRGPLDIDRAARLLDAYVAVSPLQPAEIEVMPLLIELMWLQGELDRVLSTMEGSVDYHLEVLSQGRWLAEWMRDHSDQIVDQWVGLNTVRSASESVPLAA